MEAAKLKHTISLFLLMFAFISLGPRLSLSAAAADRETTPHKESFLSFNRAAKEFNLNLTEQEARPILFFADMDETQAAAVRRQIELEAFCDSFLEEDRENEASGGAAQPKKVKSKRFGRALLVNACIWLADSTRYWATYAGWIEDWQFKLTWKGQKVRFTSFEANRFDSNPFHTNWSHGLSGAVYYNMARYHRLNVLESLLFEIGSSFWWEYITEFREVIAINDNFFSGVGGLPIGESLFRLGDYLTRQPGAFNKVLGYVLNPVIGINDLFGGKKWRMKFEDEWSAQPHFDLYLGQKQVSFKEDPVKPDPHFYIGIDTAMQTIPGYGDPGADNGDISRFIKAPMLTEMSFDAALSAKKMEEYNFFARVVLFGHFSQKLRQDANGNIKGRSLYLAAASAFDLFRKSPTVYYDKGQYHYDFTAGEQAPQPTEFKDKLAVINLIGPVFDLSLYSGSFKFRLSLNAYCDFALVHSLAVNEYSAVHDLYNPELKTTLSHYGYYYAFGFTLSGRSAVDYKNLEISGRWKYQSYDSIEGRDRFQNKVEDDCNVTDYRLLYRISAAYAISKSPVKLAFTYENIERKGSLKDITQRETETRFYTQLKLSF